MEGRISEDVQLLGADSGWLGRFKDCSSDVVLVVICCAGVEEGCTRSM